MIHMLIVILDDSSLMPTLLHAWEAIGAPGATILASAGSYRSRTWLSRMGLGAVDNLFSDKEVQRHTLLVAIETDELLEQAIAEAVEAVEAEAGFEIADPGFFVLVQLMKPDDRGHGHAVRVDRGHVDRRLDGRVIELNLGIRQCRLRLEQARLGRRERADRLVGAAELDEGCGPLALEPYEGLAQGTAVTNGRVFGYLSYKMMPDKPSPSADVYWGFHPYRFDHAGMTEVIRWVLGEHFGLTMTR